MIMFLDNMFNYYWKIVNSLKLQIFIGKAITQNQKVDEWH